MFVSTILFHYLMFGQNSLMDTSQGYDLKDPAKSHHPLITGEISLTSAHNVIHWGLALATVWAMVLTLLISPVPKLAMGALLIWVVFGWGYNLGLSKESIWGWVSLDIGYTGMGAWAWLMSHSEITFEAVIYLAYVWLLLMFQITWEGFLKDMELSERSNFIKKLGGSIYAGSIPAGIVRFDPGWKGLIYAWAVKLANLFVLIPLVPSSWSPELWRGGIWFTGMGLAAVFFANKLIAARVYDRSQELLNMSLEEVVSIYLIVPIMLPWSTAVPLMLLGVIYFFGINMVLWGTPYPRV